MGIESAGLTAKTLSFLLAVTCGSRAEFVTARALRPAAESLAHRCRPLANASAQVVKSRVPLVPLLRAIAEPKVATKILIFVDTDVVPAQESLSGLCIEAEPLSAPSCSTSIWSRLHPTWHVAVDAHACVHEMGNPEAGTFWHTWRRACQCVGRTEGSTSACPGLPWRTSSSAIVCGALARRLSFRGKRLKKWQHRYRRQLSRHPLDAASSIAMAPRMRWSVVLAYSAAASGACDAVRLCGRSRGGRDAEAYHLEQFPLYRGSVKRRGWAFAWPTCLCNGRCPLWWARPCISGRASAYGCRAPCPKGGSPSPGTSNRAPHSPLQ